MKDSVSSRRLSSAALWVRARHDSTRSIAQVLPSPTWAHVAWLSLLPAFLLAGTPDPAANLSACKNGWPSCEPSRLTLVEVTEVAAAQRARNAWNCRNDLGSCDRSKLTEAEGIAVAVAAYDRNLSNCKAGFNPRSEERRVGKECRSRWSPYH